MWLELLYVAGMTLLLTRLLIVSAPFLKLLDRPNERSVHHEPTPRGGGVAFVLAALSGLALFHRELTAASFPLFAALGLMLGIGFLDDRHDAAPRLKFLVIFVATLMLWVGGLLIDEVGSFFGLPLSLGVLALPFTYFAVAGFTNAMNLVDGIDGLAASLALIILGAFIYLGWSRHDALLELFALYFAAGVAVFLLFNWHPAKIFMGDSGSLTLGFLIAMLAIRALEYLPPVSVLYLGAIPILDTLVAMRRRRRAGRSPFAPDRCHFHHLLLRRTGSVRLTVGILAALQLLGVLVALSMPRSMDQGAAMLLYLLLFILAYRWTLRSIGNGESGCFR